MDDRREGYPAGPAAPPWSVLPAHVVVLALTAVLAVLAVHQGAAAHHEAAVAGAVPPGTRRLALFVHLFNVVVAPALVVAWLAELVGAAVARVRGVSMGRIFLRVLFALLPAAVLVVGHSLVNPWFVELVTRAVRGG